jgi:tetratricopeptide (TPR) repeat protein
MSGFLRLGVYYFNQQKLNLAFREFSLAYNQNPLNVNALNNMALIIYKYGDKKTSLQMLKWVCGLAPNYNIGLINIWLMYKNENMRTYAEEVRKKLKKSKVDLSGNTTFIIDDL